MAVIINPYDNTIRMTRGDSLCVGVDMTYPDGTSYEPTEGDSITFSVKSSKMTVNDKEFVNKQPLISKSIPTDTLLLELQPEDTMQLPFGNYVYDIAIVYASGYTDTFIENANLILVRESHSVRE